MTTAHLTAARVTAPRLKPGCATVTRESVASSAMAVGQSRLRLTRRGRAVVAAFVASLIAGPFLALTLALGAGTAAATDDLATGTFDYVTVEAGQSLWQLAQSVAPKSDPRDVISDIVHLNRLSSSVVHPGDKLAIPRAYSR